MNTAEKTIQALRHKFQDNQYLGAYVAIDNNDLHDDLNDSAVGVKDILEQETWIMSDGSYITRNEDLYFFGDSIEVFELKETMLTQV